MPAIPNSLQLIGTSLIYVALLGTLIGLVMQFVSELHHPKLSLVSHDFQTLDARLTTQVAIELCFDVNKPSANNSNKFAA